MKSIEEVKNDIIKNIKITEKEWNKEGGFELLKKYSFDEIMDYFCFIEYPKIEARQKCLKKDKND